MVAEELCSLREELIVRAHHALLPRMPKALSHRWSRAVLSGTARQPWESPWARTLTARCIKTGLIGTSELSGMLAAHSLVRTRPAEVRDFSTNL